MQTKIFVQSINPIGFVDNVIIGSTGSFTIVYKLVEAPCFSLDKDEYEKINQIYFTAFSRFNSDVIVHKQDIYIRKQFDETKMPDESFISKAERAHFKGNNFLEHSSYLSFTLINVKALDKAYLANPISYKDDIDKGSLSKLNVFLEDVETIITQLLQIPKLKIKELDRTEVKQYIDDYRNGFFFDNVRRDLLVSDTITTDTKKGAFYCIDTVESLPNSITTERVDKTLLAGNSDLYCSFLESVGVNLQYTHVVNQIWSFDRNYQNDFNYKIKQYGQHRAFDKQIESQFNKLELLERELVEEGNIICKYAFNVFLWEEESCFLKASDKLNSELRLLDIKAYKPQYRSLYNAFMGSLIGNERNLHSDFYFLTDLKTSLALMVHTSTFKDDKEGVYFNNRLDLKPFLVDLHDKPIGNKIPARNGIIIAGTGGGKSVLGLNIVQQRLEQGYKVVVVEFGRSFKQLTQLYPDRSIHIDYKKDTPLGINPFDIPGEIPDDDKILTLAHIVLKFMQDKSLKNDAKQITSLSSLLRTFYKTDSEKSFEGFYNFIDTNKEVLFELLGIKEKFFEIDTFLHVCKEFLEGGAYENVTKTSGLSDEIRTKDLVVFELTNIKNDKFLLSVIISIIMDVIQTKLLDRATRGLLFFDEYAEAQTVKDEYDGEDMHANVAFCYQKIRKENGCVYTVLQTPDQLREDEYSRGIISNTQLLFVLPTTETVYNAIARKFEINKQAHINQMKSIQNGFELSPAYSEVFLRIQDKDAVVLRLSLSQEKLLAFQTDGEIWTELQKEAENKGVEKAITNFLNK